MASLSRIGLGSLMAVALSVAPAFADVVFTDYTFFLPAYSASPTFNTDAAVNIVFGSSPDTLQVATTFTNTATPVQGAVGLTNNGFSYNPLTQGAITSIDASVSKELTVDFNLLAAGGNTFRPTILQDGIYYLAAIAGPGLVAGPGPQTTGFHTLAQSGLTAADFLSFSFATGLFGSANPNFDGDPMLFGLTQITGISTFDSPTDTPGHEVAQYQDLSLDIHSVPEPSTIALFGATLLGLGWLYRRKSA